MIRDPFNMEFEGIVYEGQIVDEIINLYFLSNGEFYKELSSEEYKIKLERIEK